MTLQRFTLGLIHVEYTPTERAWSPADPAAAPAHLQGARIRDGRLPGIVRWRIEKGSWCRSAGGAGDGYLEIDIRRRHDEDDAGKVRLNVAVEVANFYPSLGGPSRRLYAESPSRRSTSSPATTSLRRRVRRDLGDLPSWPFRRSAFGRASTRSRLLLDAGY